MATLDLGRLEPSSFSGAPAVFSAKAGRTGGADAVMPATNKPSFGDLAAKMKTARRDRGERRGRSAHPAAFSSSFSSIGGGEPLYAPARHDLVESTGTPHLRVPLLSQEPRRVGNNFGIAYINSLDRIYAIPAHGRYDHTFR
jgi:hypothetical protein